MSFVRPGRKPGRRKMTFVRKRPQWDDSVTDLDSYRATAEEVAQRKEAHKSKNHLSVKLEKLRKERQSVQKGQNNVQAREVAIVKEVLHSKQQLQKVLTKTDKMLATVEDIFGDDAKKFTGHPNVTLLSGGQSHSLPAPPKIQTRIEKLSESVTSQSALNDLSDSSEEEEPPDPISFHPGLDIQQFQQFVTSEEENCNSNAVPASIPLSTAQLQRLQQILLAEGQDVPNTGDHLGTISDHPAGASALFDQQTQVPAHSTCLLEHRGIRTPPNSEETDCTDRPTRQSALNDTGKTKKSRRRVQPTQSAQTSSSSFTMTDMRQMLDSLQAEVADFERRTGRRSDTEGPSTETFSGYTQQLLTVIAKLIHYFKETDLRLQAEIEVRERLSQDVQHLTGIVNFQTQEMIESRWEYGKLEKDFLHFRQEMQGEMALLRAELLDLKHQQSAQASNHSTPVKAASASSEPAEEKYSALPDQFTQASAAVLLSPVVRKTRVCDNPQPETATSEWQHQLPTSLSSSTLASCSDPPHLTQTLPVMATVNVPRPIPLVQSNVGLPLSGSQAAGPLVQSQSQGPSHFIASMSSEGAAGTVPTGLSASASSTNYKKSQALDTQIAELNRKHAEAEQRLQSLLVQQERQMNHLTVVHKGGGGGEGDKTQLPHRNKPPVVQEGVVPSVSPPISPIPHQPKSFTQPDPIQRLASMSRQIQITMPAMDLEVSGNSFSTSH